MGFVKYEPFCDSAVIEVVDLKLSHRTKPQRKVNRENREARQESTNPSVYKESFTQNNSDSAQSSFVGFVRYAAAFDHHHSAVTSRHALLIELDLGVKLIGSERVSWPQAAWQKNIFGTGFSP